MLYGMKFVSNIVKMPNTNDGSTSYFCGEKLLWFCGTEIVVSLRVFKLYRELSDDTPKDDVVKAINEFFGDVTIDDHEPELPF